MRKIISIMLSVVFLGLALIFLWNGFWEMNHSGISHLSAKTLVSDVENQDEQDNSAIIQDFGTITIENAEIPERHNSSENPEGEKTVQTWRTTMNMNLREEPNAQAAVKGTAPANTDLEIEQIQDGEGQSIWGKLTNGLWICLQDESRMYCVMIPQQN